MPAPPNSAQQAASRAARSRATQSSNDGAHRGRSPSSPSARAETREAVKSGRVSAAKAKENENQARAQHAANFPNKETEKEKSKDDGPLGTAKELAMAALRKFEDFISTPAYDKTAYRAGYGSDTYTTADGVVHTVRQGVPVSREDAERDLSRRVDEFAEAAKNKIGAAAWSKLDDKSKAAITSVTYNYGSLERGPDKPTAAAQLKNLVEAARTGSPANIAKAIKGLSANKSRREQEAAMVQGADIGLGKFASIPGTPSVAKKVATGIAGLLKSAIEGKPIKKEDIVQGGKEALIASIPGGPIMEFAGRLAMQKIQTDVLTSKVTTPDAVRTALGVAGMLPGGLGIMAQGIAGGIEIADPKPKGVGAKVQSIADRFGIKTGPGKSAPQDGTRTADSGKNIFAQRAATQAASFSQMSAPPTTATLAAAGFQNAAYDATKPFSWSNNPFLSVNPAPDAGIIPKVTVDPTTPGPLTQMGFSLEWLTVEAGFALAALLLIAFGIWVMVRGKNSTNITIGEK